MQLRGAPSQSLYNASRQVEGSATNPLGAGVGAVLEQAAELNERRAHGSRVVALHGESELLAKGGWRGRGRGIRGGRRGGRRGVGGGVGFRGGRGWNVLGGCRRYNVVDCHIVIRDGGGRNRRNRRGVVLGRRSRGR